MINFTIGPVMSNGEVRSVGSEQVPYFRTPEFSEMMLENEQMMLRLAKAPAGSRVVFLTGSGTAAMEASVINFFSKNDKVLVIDGGSFGHRFVELLDIHAIPHSVIKPEFGCGVTEEQLAAFDGQGYTGFLVNLDETSVGVLYDIDLIGGFCRRNGLFLVVDSISSFLCDPFDMERSGVDVMITSSQKALACPPGISVLVMSREAVHRAEQNRPRSLYFDLKPALLNGERGQTPFTPAVGILRQMNARLRQIERKGGAGAEVERTGRLATYFRERIKDMPLRIASRSLSNAVTPLMVGETVSAFTVFTVLKEEYGIWICPNGGELKEKLFRVGHIGDLTVRDFDVLLDALRDLQIRGLL
jgi:aspartate aminotransferase-like enzyme